MLLQLCCPSAPACLSTDLHASALTCSTSHTVLCLLIATFTGREGQAESSMHGWLTRTLQRSQPEMACCISTGR